MDTTTSEVWDIDGVPLNTYCWNIKSFGGSRQSLPKLRGDNRQLPFKPGRRHLRNKLPDSKVITLAMWVAGVDPDTGKPSTVDQIIQWNDNWDSLRRAVWKPGLQLDLTKRWWRNATAPELITATAQAELAGDMEPSMTGRSRADFAIDFLLADPFFYGDLQTITVPLNVDFAIDNPGDSRVMHNFFSVDFQGQLVNPTLLNKTNDVWMQVNTLISQGTSVSTNIASFNATRSTDGTSIASAITQGGARHWMSLESGTNVMRLTSTGTGAAVVTFRPAYV